MAEEKEKYDRICNTIREQVELLLCHINEKLKGTSVSIQYCDENLSRTGNFLKTESLLINIELHKQADGGANQISLIVYSLSPDADQFEIVFHIDEASPIYQLLPEKIRDGLNASLAIASDLEIVL